MTLPVVVREALALAKEIIDDELRFFIENNSSHVAKGKKLDRKHLTGYELDDLERLERAADLLNSAAKVD